MRVESSVLARRTAARYASAAIVACAMLSGTAIRAQHRPVVPTPLTATAEAGLPHGWRHVPIAFWKRATRYGQASEAGTTVMRAVSDGSASSLVFRLDVEPADRPGIEWQWKIITPVTGADNRIKDAEDASARLMLEFDGNVDPEGGSGAGAFVEQLIRANSPHAVLMYITSDREPVESIIHSPRTDHIRMLVVGPAAAGTWSRFVRDYRGDFMRAFGRAPGRLTTLGVMTDTDNTGSFAQTYYGDVRLLTGDELTARASGNRRAPETTR